MLACKQTLNKFALPSKAMIISIAGKPGSGKSTVAKLLAKKLKYSFFSAGDLRGKIATKHKMTIEELNKVGEKERWTDEECDTLLEKMGKQEDNVVFDSRLAWHFVPQSFKIFLDVDLHEAAKRVFANPRKDEKKTSSVDETYKNMLARHKSDVTRYKKWYKLDIDKMKNYDVVIDTTKLTQERVFQKVLDAVKQCEESAHDCGCC